MVKRSASRNRTGVDGDKELRTLQEILVGRSARAISERVDALEELVEQEEAERTAKMNQVQKVLLGRLDRLSRNLTAEQESRRKAIKGRVESDRRLRERIEESQSETRTELATLRKELMTEIDRRDKAARAELRKQVRDLKRSFVEVTNRFQAVKVDRDQLARTFIELASGLDPGKAGRSSANSKKRTGGKAKKTVRKTSNKTRRRKATTRR